MNEHDRATPSRRTLTDPDTPFLALDPATAQANIERLRKHLDRLGVGLRAHVKTTKSVDVAALLSDGRPGPVTVSTLAEAEAFAAAGYRDILYAVGIAPHKLPRVAALRGSGVDLAVLLDSVEQAAGPRRRVRGRNVPALIEIDCDGHRGGVQPDDPALLEIAPTLRAGGAVLRGVLDTRRRVLLRRRRRRRCAPPPNTNAHRRRRPPTRYGRPGTRRRWSASVRRRPHTSRPTSPASPRSGPATSSSSTW